MRGWYELLKFLLKRFNGDVSLALAGYNAGEGSVDKYKGVPPYNKTQNYVKKIVGTYGKTYHPVLTPNDAKQALVKRKRTRTAVQLFNLRI